MTHTSKESSYSTYCFPVQVLGTEIQTWRQHVGPRGNTRSSHVYVLSHVASLPQIAPFETNNRMSPVPSVAHAPQATQLRLNAELDAGARAAISDMETYLCAPSGRPPNAKRPSGGKVNGDVNDNDHLKRQPHGHPGGLTANGRTSSHMVRIVNGTNNNSTNGNTRGTSYRADSKRALPIQPGRKVVPHSMISGVEAGNGRNLATSQHGPAARSAMAVSRTRGGGVWDTDTNDTDKFSFNIDHEDNGQHGGRQEHGVVAMARGDAATTESPLFRLSERVKGEARASGECRMLKKAASGCSLSPRPGDYADRHSSSVSLKLETSIERSTTSRDTIHLYGLGLARGVVVD